MQLSPQQEEALIRAASQMPTDQREAFLDTMCAGDAAFRSRVVELLDRSETVPDESKHRLATIKVEVPPEEEAIGKSIGRYKILQKIGEGGCGAVYMAEQEQPVRRRVALKVIKLGMDTKAVIARFEAERQALALMDHPNIAKVLDAGATEAGRPYFVMELVRGIKLTEYCDQNHLGVRQRLELFTQICQAIQHAHQKGIIHRDIKPSNILVTLHDGVPVPKVIDFGIAKATTDQRLTDKTLFTAYEQFIGTPAYMSPEQAEMSGLDIDTRSDIYSLGVLLYELLTGRTPFDPKELMESGLEAMRKTIREKDPVRPSTKLHTLAGEELTTTARRHGVEGAKLESQLRGDLDWIVMKCLEKDRTRRYETANGLAMDIKRHLNNETVIARPPSKLYEFQKTFRRHKVGFITTAGVIAALAVGVALATWQALLATRAKQQALAAQSRESIQREKAEANERNALEARASEATLRKQAQEQELLARRRAYASDMNVALQAFDGSNLGRALDLLNRQRPGPGQKDLRGWEWRYLWGLTHSDALYTLCQKSEIESLAASANGDWLAIGLVHKDGLFVYDLHSRKEVAHLAHGEAEVRAAFSPVGPLLAFTTATDSRSALRLWNAATRQVVSEFPLETLCMGLAFAKDGRILATATKDGRITLWRIPDGARLASYSGESKSNHDSSTDFAANTDLSLAAYGEGERIHLVDLDGGKELWKAVASKFVITALAFSPDGKILASAAGYGESDIRLWDVATGKEIGRLEGHQSWVGSLVFWPDGKKMASCSADQTIQIWDVANRKSLDVLRGHRQEVWRVALLADNKTLVSGCKDGTVCLWDTSVTHRHPPRITVPAKVSNWCFSPDSRSLLTLDWTSQVAQWSGSDFQERGSGPNLGTNYTTRLFSSDARFLAVGSTNGNILVLDLSRGGLRREFKVGKGNVFPVSFLAQGHRLVVWFPTGNDFSEWDLDVDRETQSWAAPALFNPAGSDPVSGFGVSPDERLAIGIGWHGDVSARNLPDHSATNLALDALEGSSVAFSSDGAHFAIASYLGFARVWDNANWREEATLRGFLNAVSSVAFSQDGKRLATGGSTSDDAVKLWDVDSWQELLTLRGVGSLYGITAFSPDGNAIATMSQDGILSVWRAPSWEEIQAADAKDKMGDQRP